MLWDRLVSAFNNEKAENHLLGAEAKVETSTTSPKGTNLQDLQSDCRDT